LTVGCEMRRGMCVVSGGSTGRGERWEYGGGSEAASVLALGKRCGVKKWVMGGRQCAGWRP